MGQRRAMSSRSRFSGGIRASKLTITTQPSSSATSGSAFAQQPVIQLRDPANNAVPQAGVVVTVAVASGVDVLSGTVTVTTNTSGVATYTNLALTGGTVNTLTFTATGLTGVTSSSITVSGGGFNPPTLFGPDNFTTGTGNWNGWINWSFGNPPARVSVDTTSKIVGTNSAKRVWTDSVTAGGEQSCEFIKVMGSNLDRFFFRFKFRCTGALPTGSTTTKFFRIVDDSFNHDLGGIWLDGDGKLKFGFDFANEAVTTDINLPVVPLDTLITIEVDYWLNGAPSGNPSVKIWCNDVVAGYPPGTQMDQYNGTTRVGVWDSGGRLDAGNRPAPSVGWTGAIAEIWPTMNNGVTAPGGIFYVGAIAASTERIGMAA